MIEKILKYVDEKIQYGSDLLLNDLIRGVAKSYEIDNLDVSEAQNVPTGAILRKRMSLEGKRNEIICIFESRNMSSSKKAFVPEVYIQIYTKTSPPIKEVYLIEKK